MRGAAVPGFVQPHVPREQRLVVDGPALPLQHGAPRGARIERARVPQEAQRQLTEALPRAELTGQPQLIWGLQAHGRVGMTGRPSALRGAVPDAGVARPVVDAHAALRHALHAAGRRHRASSRGILLPGPEECVSLRLRSSKLALNCCGGGGRPSDGTF